MFVLSPVPLEVIFGWGGLGGQAAEPIKNDGYCPKWFRNTGPAPQIAIFRLKLAFSMVEKIVKRHINDRVGLKSHKPQVMNCPKIQLPP